MRRTLSSLTTALFVVGGLVQPVGGAVHIVHAAAPPPVVAAPAGGTISGQVTDDHGAPLDGVNVQVQGSFSRTTSSGPNGRYSFTGLTDGSYRVAVNTGSPTPPTFSPLRPYPELINVTSVVGQAGVDFELPRPAIVTGTVRNQDGIPIPNAQIAGLSFFQSLTTGPDGRYLTTVDAGPHTISAAAVGYVGNFSISPGATGLNAKTIDTVSGQVTTTDFVLDAGGAISGRVLDADGLPVPSAFVTANLSDPATGAVYSASIAANISGVYVLRGLLPGDYIVTTFVSAGGVSRPLYFPGTPDLAAAQPVTVVEGATTASIDFNLPVPEPLGPPITITSVSPLVFRQGTTTSAIITGSGFVPGATVEVDSFGPTPQPKVSSPQVIDSEHLSVIVTTPADAQLGGDGGIQVFQQGQSAQCFCGFFVADATSTFGTISGHVTRASDGTSFANVRVFAQTTAASSQFLTSTLSLADGSYRLGPLPTGEYLVKFSTAFSVTGFAAEYYLDAKTDVTGTPVAVVADGDTGGIDAALEFATTPSITSASPAVLAPGTTTDVTVTGTGFGLDDTFQVSTPSFSQPAPQIISKRVLSSTEVHLSIRTAPLTPSSPVSISVFPEGGGFGAQCNCLSISTVPQSTGTVAGAVIDPLGNGLGSIRVTAVADGQTQATSSGWTGSDGTYALRLPAGSYALHFEDLGGAVADAVVPVAVGDLTTQTNATITPLASFGAISGAVINTSGSNLAGALVQATNTATGETSATVASPGGLYRFPTLASGDYTIEFSEPGYQDRWYIDAADAATATPISVVNGAENVGINGTLPLSRRPLAVASVTPDRVAVGESLQATINGSGFAFGDVTNLSFSAGDGVTITPLDVSPDSTATVSIAVDPAATPGPRDVTATRDDGQHVTCVGCLRIFAALGSISGTVATASGAPLDFGAHVAATSASTGEVFTVTPAPDGSYLLDRLPVDDYRVMFFSANFVTQWYNNAPSAATASPVTVGAAPVTGIDATLQPGRRFLFVRFLTPSSLQRGTTTSVSINGQGFLDGGVTNLSFTADPGVTISVTGVQSDTTATASVTVGADATLGFRPLQVSRDDGSTSTCVTCLNITQPPGSISGRVTGTGGAAVQFGFVQAFKVGVGASFPVASAQVQPDGNYSMTNLVPGDYQVQFSAFPYIPEWWNDAPTQAQATTITVGSGQAVTGIDAQLSVASPPLQLNPNFYEAYQGASRSVTVFGNGFQTGVTGLAFSAGPGVHIAIDTVFNDQFANITITTDPGTDLGLRDLVATRDDGQTATCVQCLSIVPAPPGQIVGTANDADTDTFLFGTVTATPIGGVAPVASQFFFGSFFLSGLAAGDYDVTIDSSGYETFVTRVTVVAGQSTVLNASLVSIRQPLTYAGPSSLIAYQGFPQQLIVSGSGFRSGGVTGLTFSAGPDVTITVDSVLSDNSAQITMTAGPTAEPSTRDLTVTRDDGQVAVCTGCVVVSPPAPGSLFVTIFSSDTGNFLTATVTATLVGQSTPSASVSAFGGIADVDLAAGDYDVLFESPGYVSATQRITIRPAQQAFTSVFLDLTRQTLTITSVSPTLDTGTDSFVQVNGSGFRAGGVTGLAAALNPQLAVNGVVVVTDSVAIVEVIVPQDAVLGAYDLIMSRDPDESATCTGCITVRHPPAFIFGFVSDAQTGEVPFATVTATKVGDTEPTATTTAFGFYSLQVPEGDYIIKAEASGFDTQWYDHVSSAAEATAVSVASAAVASGIDFALPETRNPLRIDFLTSTAGVPQGQSIGTAILGSGFFRGGVTGLAFSAGAGVTITVDQVIADSFVLATISAAGTAAPGVRDLVVTRDDGAIATCGGCLNIVRGQPIVNKVSPSIVREGKATITITGTNLQRVIKVSTSSRRVTVPSFKNNANGSITVQIKIDGGGRRSYTLTFTRDDGSTFTADFAVR